MLDEPAARGDAPAARVEAIVTRVATVTMRMLPEVSVLFRVRGNSKTERDAMARRRAFDSAVAELVRAAQRNGEMRKDIDAALLTRLAFGMSNSVAEWYRPSGSIPAEQIARAIRGLLFEGAARV